MAQNARLFMELRSETTNNEIEGESQAKGFEKQIEIDDWSWSVDREEMSDEQRKLSGKSASGTRKSSSNTGWPDAGLLTKPAVFSFNKSTDRSTVTMLNALTKGQLLKAKITLTEKTGAVGGELGSLFDLVIQLEKVRITGYSLEGEVGDSLGELTERWTFDYRKITFDYQPPEQTGRVKEFMERAAGESTEEKATGETSEKEFVERLDEELKKSQVSSRVKTTLLDRGWKK